MEYVARQQYDSTNQTSVTYPDLAHAIAWLQRESQAQPGAVYSIYDADKNALLVQWEGGKVTINNLRKS